MAELRILFFACSGAAAPAVIAGFARALERAGHTVKVADPAVAAEEKLFRASNDLAQLLEGFDPHLAVLYAVPRAPHFYDADGLFCLDVLSIPYVCLWYDNPFVYLQELSPVQREKLKNSPRALQCCSDTFYIEELRKNGFRQVEYLPLAADPELFFPEGDVRGPGISESMEISFVGSIDDDPERLRQQRRKRWEKFPILNKTIDEMTGLSNGQSSLDMAHKISRLQEHLPGDVFAVFCRTVYEEAATFVRMQTVGALQEWPVAVYGGPGWQRLGQRVQWRGVVPYGEALRAVYCATRINLNITSPQLRGGITQRLFDASACGAFVLSDYRQDVRQLFGEAIVTYDDFADLRKKTAYFLTRASERHAYAQQAREKVMSRHTYAARAQALLAAAASILPLREPVRRGAGNGAGTSVPQQH
ncbi:MAG: glycosyltransferase [Candidatus Omnitrophica bacterium]|nr:glycosyltransferase [Candidatus Omnitrophota bacterium]